MRYRKGFGVGSACAAAAGRAAESEARAVGGMCVEMSDAAVSGFLSSALSAASGAPALGAMIDWLGPGPSRFHESPECAVVLWERHRRAPRVVAVLWADGLRRDDWRCARGAWRTPGVELTAHGRRRFGWACVLPGRESDVLDAWPCCGLGDRGWDERAVDRAVAMFAAEAGADNVGGLFGVGHLSDAMRSRGGSVGEGECSRRLEAMPGAERVRGSLWRRSRRGAGDSRIVGDGIVAWMRLFEAARR